MSAIINHCGHQIVIYPFDACPDESGRWPRPVYRYLIDGKEAGLCHERYAEALAAAQLEVEIYHGVDNAEVQKLNKQQDNPMLEKRAEWAAKSQSDEGLKKFFEKVEVLKDSDRISNITEHLCPECAQVMEKVRVDFDKWFCATKGCPAYENSPEQKLLREMFGEDPNESA